MKFNQKKYFLTKEDGIFVLAKQFLDSKNLEFLFPYISCLYPLPTPHHVKEFIVYVVEKCKEEKKEIKRKITIIYF